MTKLIWPSELYGIIEIKFSFYSISKATKSCVKAFMSSWNGASGWISVLHFSVQSWNGWITMHQNLTSKGFRANKGLSLEYHGFKPQNVSLNLQVGRKGFHCALATGVKPAVTSLSIVKMLPVGRPHYVYWLNISRRNGYNLPDKCVNVSVPYIAV